MRENISNESEKQLAGAYPYYHKPDSFFASRSEWTVRVKDVKNSWSVQYLTLSKNISNSMNNS